MELLYYKVDDSPFPSSPTEHLGHWVGISEHAGHAMTFKIWNKTTGKVLDRSSVRTALDSTAQNLQANNLVKPTDTAIPPAIPPLDPLTAPDYGENTMRPCNTIYSTDYEGVKEDNSYAEAAYLTDDAKRKDYLAPPLHLKRITRHM